MVLRSSGDGKAEASAAAADTVVVSDGSGNAYVITIQRTVQPEAEHGVSKCLPDVQSVIALAVVTAGSPREPAGRKHSVARQRRRIQRMTCSQINNRFIKRPYTLP